MVRILMAHKRMAIMAMALIVMDYATSELWLVTSRCMRASRVTAASTSKSLKLTASASHLVRNRGTHNDGERSDRNSESGCGGDGGKMAMGTRTGVVDGGSIAVHFGGTHWPPASHVVVFHGTNGGCISRYHVVVFHGTNGGWALFELSLSLGHWRGANIETRVQMPALSSCHRHRHRVGSQSIGRPLARNIEIRQYRHHHRRQYSHRHRHRHQYRRQHHYRHRHRVGSQSIGRPLARHKHQNAPIPSPSPTPSPSPSPILSLSLSQLPIP